jgi:hypothetical protein
VKDLLEMIEVMQNFHDGHILQYYSNGEWVETKHPTWDWSNIDYRTTERSIDDMISKLMEYEINMIKEAVDNDDDDYLENILSGEAFIQYANMSDKQIIEQFDEMNEERSNKENQ